MENDPNNLSAPQRVLNFLLRAYVTVDLRTLALFRVSLCLLALWDLATRAENLTIFYTNEGVLPNHFALFRPSESTWSLLNAFSTPGEVRFYFLITAIIEILVLFGEGGVLARFVMLLLHVSIDTRNLFLEHGGHLVLNIALVWSVLLPVDLRFRFESLRKWKGHFLERLKEELSPGTYTGLPYLGVLVTLFCIYLFNSLTKNGNTWMEGTAFYYALNLTQHATPLAIWLRTHLPFGLLRALSHSALLIEYAVPLLLVIPCLRRWTLGAALIGIWLLHGGITATLNVGIFGASLMVFSLLLIQTAHWDFLLARLGFWASSPVSGNQWVNGFKQQVIVQVLAVILITAVIDRSIGEYRGKLEANHLLGSVSSFLVRYLRINQSWRMFAPNAPLKDYAVVIEGIRPDGSALDLDTGNLVSIKEPETLHRYFDEYQHKSCDWVHWQLRMLFAHFIGDPGYISYFGLYLFANHDINEFWVHHLERQTHLPGQTRFPVTVKTLYHGKRGATASYVLGRVFR